MLFVSWGAPAWLGLRIQVIRVQIPAHLLTSCDPQQAAYPQ